MSTAEHRLERTQSASVKVVFTLPPDPDHEFTREALWAKPLPSSSYILENVPFFIYGVSFGDEIEAKRQNGRLQFIRVVQHCGHSTYRVFLSDEAHDQVSAMRSRLDAMGCLIEDGGSLWFALDVPPEADIFAVYELLEKGEESGIWTFEEGHCGHLSVDKLEG